MKHLPVLLIAACLASPVLAQSAAERTGVNSMVGAAPATADFVKEAATSDMFEIASSKLAVERGDQATKKFAQQMISDHQKTSAELKQMLSQKKIQVVLPKAMSSDQQQKVDDLKKLKGADFNRQYHSDQVSAHKDAVDLFKRYGDGGENADLKAWAAKTHPALEHHLEMAQSLDK